jgi:hypothetical protein
MTGSTDVIEASEVRPLVTVEAGGLGVLTRRHHRMHSELSLAPGPDGHVTVAATEGYDDVVRTHVAAAAVLRLNVEILFFVTVETGGHGADGVTVGSVEAVADSTMTVTTADTPRRLQNGLMRDMQEFSSGWMTEVSVAEEARLLEARRGVRDKSLMGDIRVSRARSPAVTSHASQAAVDRLDG